MLAVQEIVLCNCVFSMLENELTRVMDSLNEDPYLELSYDEYEYDGVFICVSHVGIRFASGGIRVKM